MGESHTLIGVLAPYSEFLDASDDSAWRLRIRPKFSGMYLFQSAASIKRGFG